MLKDLPGFDKHFHDRRTRATRSVRRDRPGSRRCIRPPAPGPSLSRMITESSPSKNDHGVKPELPEESG